MRARRGVIGVLAIGLLLAGCESEPGPGEGTLVEGPRDADDIVQHLVEAPEYPAPVTGDAELVELRSPEGTNRHQAFLAELATGGTLEGELVRGAIIQLGDGVTLSVPSGASVASLVDDEVVEVTACDAPCDVTGPALVAPPEWLPGIQVAAGWQLIAPAPAD